MHPLTWSRFSLYKISGIKLLHHAIFRRNSSIILSDINVQRKDVLFSLSAFTSIAVDKIKLVFRCIRSLSQFLKWYDGSTVHHIQIWSNWRSIVHAYLRCYVPATSELCSHFSAKCGLAIPSRISICCFRTQMVLLYQRVQILPSGIPVKSL